MFPSVRITVSRTIFDVVEWNKKGTLRPVKVVTSPSLPLGIILGYFDGDQKNGLCGGGMLIKIKDKHIIKLKIGTGKGSNTILELIYSWGLLWFSILRGFLLTEVYGDSKIIIDWVNGKNDLHLLSLSGWMQIIRKLMENLHELYFKHIYRVLNREVDVLSKEAIGYIT